jgi:alpha-beta hydrolase superfamily lysophospholipase
VSAASGIDLALTAPDGLKLHLVDFAVDRPRGVVVMLHGLCEHARRHVLTALALNGAGWAVLAPDLRGHGQSEGPRGGMAQDDSLLRDLASLLDLAAERYPGLPRVVLGHSTGGAVAARFAAELSLSVAQQAAWSRPMDGLMLSSPALQTSIGMVQKALLTTMGKLMQDVGLPVMFKPEWFSSDPAVIREFEQDPLTHKQITPRLAAFIDQQGRVSLSHASTWTVPTLLLYTPQDRLVSTPACATLAARLPAHLCRTQTFPDLAHDMLREPGRARVHAAMSHWLGDTFPTAP